MKRRPQFFRQPEGAAVLAPGEGTHLRGEDRERARDRERDHGEEDGAHAQRQQPDGERKNHRDRERGGVPSRIAVQDGPKL